MNRYLAVIASMAVFAFTSCIPGNPPPHPTVAQARLFEDVPVMSGFRYQSESSFLHVGRKRVCVLKYTGRAEMLSVVKHYKDSMRANRWEHELMMGIDPIIMKFSKDDETALVVVQNLGSGEVSLIIQIGPKE